MAGINLRPDDLGTRSLTRDNATHPQARQVPGTAASAPVREERATAERGPAGAADQVRGEGPPPAGERRRGDRRKRQVPVLYDMRSGRERRQVDANPEQARTVFDQDGEEDRPPGLGIDDYA